MKFLVVLSAVVACAFAKPGFLGAGAIGYAAAPAIATPGLAAPLAYSALAAPAISYSAPAVAYSAQVAAPALAYSAPVAAPAVAYSAQVAAPALAYSAPVAAPAVAYAAPAPVSVHTQYHAQDELGQASYGHAEPFQTHNAIQDAAGNKIGSFSYLSPEGNVFKTDYVADGLGYRVASNALPVGPSLPVADTPEVVAAKAAHFAAHGAVVHRVRRQILGHTPAATAPLGHTFAAPVAYASPLPVATPFAAAPFAAAPFAAAPFAYTPAVRAGILTNIVNTPGHAVSYRID